MAYAYLIAAIVLEVCGTFCLKLSDGFARPVPSMLAFVFYGTMNVPLILALKHLDLGVVYATWAGIGVVAAVTLGAVYFGEQLTWQLVLFSTITLVGIVGLNLNLSA